VSPAPDDAQPRSRAFDIAIWTGLWMGVVGISAIVVATLVTGEGGLVPFALFFMAVILVAGIFGRRHGHPAYRSRKRESAESSDR